MMLSRLSVFKITIHHHDLSYLELLNGNKSKSVLTSIANKSTVYAL